jgi:hypothetical protein
MLFSIETSDGFSLKTNENLLNQLTLAKVKVSQSIMIMKMKNKRRSRMSNEKFPL